MRVVWSALWLALLPGLAACGGGGGAIGPTSSVPATGIPIAPQSSLTTPVNASGNAYRIDFGAGVPAGETFIYQGVAPAGFFFPASYFDGVLFSVGGSTLPLNAITSIALLPRVTPNASLSATLMQYTGSALTGNTALPFTVAPFTVAPSPPLGAQSSGPITALQPGTTYFIEVQSAPTTTTVTVGS